MKEKEMQLETDQERTVHHVICSRERILALSRGIGSFLLAYLFGSSALLFGARPLGIALLAATETSVFWVYGGVMLSALPLFGEPLLPAYLCVYTAIVLLRIALRMTVDVPFKASESPRVRTFADFRRMLFSETIALRITLGCVGAFLTGLYGMIAGGFQYYDLFASLFGLGITPVLVYLFAGLWKRGILRFRRVRDVLSVTAIAAAVVYSLRGIEFYSISLAPFAALGLSLWLCRQRGIAVGIISALAIGLCYDPIAAPLFAFGVFVFGSFHRVSVFMASLSAFFVGMAWGFYVYGLGALSTLLPALFASAMLYCVLERLRLLPGKDWIRPPTKPHQKPSPEGRPQSTKPLPEEAVVERTETLPGIEHLLREKRITDEAAKVDALCEAFLSVSALLREKREIWKYPTADEFRRVCDRVCDEFCPGCTSCAHCWGSEYGEMAESLSRMAEELHRSGRVTVDLLPEAARARCGMRDEILLGINKAAGELTAAALKREKAGLLSADYGTAAKLFRSAFHSSSGDYCLDESGSAAAEAFLRARGVFPARVILSGGRQRMLCAQSVLPEAVSRMTADRHYRSAFLRALGFLPGEPTFQEIPGGGGLADLSLTAAPRYRVNAATAIRPGGKEQGAVCGDSVSVFEGNDGRCFALLSDGMGSGRDAARLSEICTIFLRQMLSTGGDTATILKMLNEFLVSGTSGETSATVDLLEFDLLTGECAFWKSGAAPTFILREGNLFRLSSNTVPAGILPEADFQRTSFRLYSGDTVVLLSDGITDKNDGCEFLYTLLGGLDSEEAMQRAAECIVDYRTREDRSQDDRSVILLHIEETAEGEALESREDPAPLAEIPKVS